MLNLPFCHDHSHNVSNDKGLNNNGSKSNDNRPNPTTKNPDSILAMPGFWVHIDIIDPHAPWLVSN